MTSPSSAVAPLRVGVVGLGFAGTAHLKGFSALPGVEVVALSGKESDRLAALGAEFGIPSLHEDWEDLVALDDIDVVSIGTPNALHAPIALAALAAGKHVFCEKPLALSAEQARTMVAAANANDRVLEVAFNHRRRGDVQFAKQYIDETGLGRIYHVRASWKRRAGIPGITSWFTNPVLSGGGALIDLGPHIIDSVLFLLGEPRVVAVSAVTHGELGRAASPQFGVEDLASALIRLDTGASIAFEISWAGNAVDEEDISIELLGVDAGLRIFVSHYQPEDTVRIYRDVDGEHTTIAPEVVVEGGEHAIVIAEFVEHIRSGDWAAHRGDYALHRTEILDAVYRSAELGKEVAL